MLAPRLIDDDARRICKVQAPDPRAHGDPDEFGDPGVVLDVLVETGGLAAEEQRVTVLVLDVGVVGGGLPVNAKTLCGLRAA